MHLHDMLMPSMGWRHKLYIIIYGSETRAGRYFDFFLIIAIVLSVLLVILESVADFNAKWGKWFDVLDWFFTILFTIEYGLRLIAIHKPMRYVKSFFGIIDLLAILPLYLGLIIPASRFLVDIRILRLLRLLRIFKMKRSLGEANELKRALWNSRRRIGVFAMTIALLAIILGTLIYIIEGPEHGFRNIPEGIYWAIVTLTTVGFGDITPQTPLGRMLASVVMVLGYGIIAVPTSIVTTELANRRFKEREAAEAMAYDSRTCSRCCTQGHEKRALFCKLCGQPLAADPSVTSEQNQSK